MASIRKRGSRWQAQVRRVGFPPVTRSFNRKVDAQEWARLWEARADRNELPPNRKILDTITLAELVERYRDEVSIAKRGGTVEAIVLNAFLREPICQRKLSQVQASDFSAYRDRRLQLVSFSTLKRQLSPLSHMFEVARKEWGIPISANPIRFLSGLGQSSSRERRLRPGEMERLVKAAERTRNPYVRPLMLLALETGMRRSELLGLRWSSINLEQRSATIPVTKNGLPRTVPLSRSALATLAGLAHQGERLFPVTPVSLRLAWERLVRRAGIEDLHFHDLRHEAISTMFEKGLSAPEVASISGHRDIRMLLRYAHADVKRVLTRLDNTEAENHHCTPANLCT